MPEIGEFAKMCPSPPLHDEEPLSRLVASPSSFVTRRAASMMTFPMREFAYFFAGPGFDIAVPILDDHPL